MGAADGDASRASRVVMSHGKHDALLPFAVAEALRDKLRRRRRRTSRWHPFLGGHEIPAAVLAAVGEFLAAPRA